MTFLFTLSFVSKSGRWPKILAIIELIIIKAQVNDIMLYPLLSWLSERVTAAAWNPFVHWSDCYSPSIGSWMFWDSSAASWTRRITFSSAISAFVTESILLLAITFYAELIAVSLVSLALLVVHTLASPFSGIATFDSNISAFDRKSHTIGSQYESLPGIHYHVLYPSLLMIH